MDTASDGLAPHHTCVPAFDDNGSSAGRQHRDDQVVCDELADDRKRHEELSVPRLHAGLRVHAAMQDCGGLREPMLRVVRRRADRDRSGCAGS